MIRTLGFIGNAHYCPYCLNHFHDDFGQHEPDCQGIADMKANEELGFCWWDIEDRLS